MGEVNFMLCARCVAELNFPTGEPSKERPCKLCSSCLHNRQVITDLGNLSESQRGGREREDKIHNLVFNRLRSSQRREVELLEEIEELTRPLGGEEDE